MVKVPTAEHEIKVKKCSYLSRSLYCNTELVWTHVRSKTGTMQVNNESTRKMVTYYMLCCWITVWWGCTYWFMYGREVLTAELYGRVTYRITAK